MVELLSHIAWLGHFLSYWPLAYIVFILILCFCGLYVCFFFFLFDFQNTVVCFPLCLSVLFASLFSKEKERAIMELGMWEVGRSWGRGNHDQKNTVYEKN